jgi:chitinase
MKSHIAALLIALLAAALPAHARPQLPKPVVIGYVALFKDYKATLATTDLHLLTHINLAFVNPGPNASIQNGEAMACIDTHGRPPVMAQDVRDIVSQAHASGVKVMASLGGSIIPVCAGNWPTLLQPENRAALIRNLVQFTTDFNLDGLDIDLEWENLTIIDHAGNYTPFVRELSQALKAKGKRLSCATASSEGGMVPISSLPFFDYVNIMAYDYVGPTWGAPGDEHSSLAQAQGAIATWRTRGLPKSKLVLGVPFYGYGFNGYAKSYDYRTLIDTFGETASESDVQGKRCPTCQYITYNGRATIRAKAKLALDQGAGVMIWELSGDASEPDSLLQIIGETLKTPAQKLHNK